MGRTFSGSTEGASSGIIGASFFNPGTILRGKFLRKFPVTLQDGKGAFCYTFEAINPRTITAWFKDSRNVPQGTEGAEEQELTTFSIGALSGFEMAMQDMENHGWDGFKFGDVATIQCTGEQDTGYDSKQKLFKLAIERPY